MVGRSEGSQLVAVDRVVLEEKLDLVSNLRREGGRGWGREGGKGATEVGG